jgi:hypothetical protein
MSPTSSDLHHLAQAFCLAFATPSSHAHTALRAPTCTQIFAPSSINPPPPKSNAEFAAHIDHNIAPLMDSFAVTPREIHINEAGRQITIWANGTPVFKKEAMGNSREEEWEYTGEYIFILDVDEEGRIVRVLEFLDSLGTERLRGLMVRARENVGRDGEAW